MKSLFYFFSPLLRISAVKPFATKSKTPVLLHEPYLQMIGQKTVTITWKTNAVAENCEVRIQKDKSTDQKTINGILT